MIYARWLFRISGALVLAAVCVGLLPLWLVGTAVFWLIYPSLALKDKPKALAPVEEDPVMAEVVAMREVYLAAENADSVQFVLDVEAAGKMPTCSKCGREMGYRARVCTSCKDVEASILTRTAAYQLERDYHVLAASYDGAQAQYDKYGMTVAYVAGAKLQRSQYISAGGTPAAVQEIVRGHMTRAYSRRPLP